MVLEPHFLFLSSSRRRGDISDRACAILGGAQWTMEEPSVTAPFTQFTLGRGLCCPLLCGASISFTVGRARCYSGMTHRVLHVVRRNFCWRLIKIAPSLTPRPSSSSSKTPPLIRVYLRLHPPQGRDTPILPMLHKLKLILLKASPLNFLPSAIPLHLVTPTFSYFHFSKWEPGISH